MRTDTVGGWKGAVADDEISPKQPLVRVIDAVEHGHIHVSPAQASSNVLVQIG